MLEVYHSENNLYPASIEASMFPGLDQAALVDSNGSKIKVYTSASSEKEALVTAIPTKADKYQYIGFGCSATGCKGYVLRGYIEKSTAKYGENYTKTGLENPF
jgi:hypothetical protein